MMFDAVTAAEDNMQSKTIAPVFDSETAAEDNMKSKLTGAHNLTKSKGV